jgi:hypothetical protein
VANAEIAFAATKEHAGLHFAAVGATLVPVLIGYRVPLPDWCSGTCPSSEATDGRFRLELVLPRLTWSADEAITGMAILSYGGDAATAPYGSGSGLVAFSFDEVGGVRHAGYAMTADYGDPAAGRHLEHHRRRRLRPGSRLLGRPAHHADDAADHGERLSRGRA